ncbi:MAG: ECF transporter S component [Firmicutes bacterium]|nr:ECF transporter S component [Bacillota bacterium]
METQKRRSGIGVREIISIGLMAALVYAATMINVKIPLPVGQTMLSLGNVCCLLSGFLLGPVYGGLSAGVGSFIFDLGDPVWLPLSPYTLVFKFLMAFVCGLVSIKLCAEGPAPSNMPKNAVAGALGMLTYLVLHLAQVYFYAIWLKGLQPLAALIETGTSGVFSLINAAVAIIVSVPLYAAVKKILDSAGFRIRKYRF